MPQPLTTQFAVLWGMDGVLVESEPLHRDKLIAAAAVRGVTIKEKHFYEPQEFVVPDGHGGMSEINKPLHGLGDKNIYYWLLAQKRELADTLTLKRWLDELLLYYLSHKDQLKPRLGMQALVEEFDARGIIQGVVSSGIPKQVSTNLSAFGGAASKLAFALNSDDVTLSKPNPEGYLKGVKRVFDIMRQRQIRRSYAVFVAVEDSPSGVEAALNANIACIQFPAKGDAPVRLGDQYPKRFRIARDARQIDHQMRALFATRAGLVRAPGKVSHLPKNNIATLQP